MIPIQGCTAVARCLCVYRVERSGNTKQLWPENTVLDRLGGHVLVEMPILISKAMMKICCGSREYNIEAITFLIGLQDFGNVGVLQTFDELKIALFKIDYQWYIDTD